MNSEHAVRHDELNALENHLNMHGVIQDPAHTVRLFITNRRKWVNDTFGEKPKAPASSGSPFVASSAPAAKPAAPAGVGVASTPARSFVASR